MPFWQYVLLFAYPGISLMLVRSFCEHRAHEEMGGRTIIVEASPFWSLLFLNNNLHVAHHEATEARLVRIAGLLPRRARAAPRQEQRLSAWMAMARSSGAISSRPKEPVAHPLIKLITVIRQLREISMTTAHLPKSPPMSSSAWACMACRPPGIWPWRSSGRAKARARTWCCIDKTGPGAGATGIACGCVRNLYMTSPMHNILRHSVDVWESDPVNFGFQQVGYVSVGEANQQADYEKMHTSQNSAGYKSDLYVGKEAKSFLKKIWPDFNIERADVVLHEMPSGYAGTHTAVRALQGEMRPVGRAVVHRRRRSRAMTCRTAASPPCARRKATIKADCVVICAGAWITKHWDWLGLPDKLDMRYPDGGVVKDAGHVDLLAAARGRGAISRTATSYRTGEDKDPPVLHVELMNTPVVTEDGHKFPDQHFYMYVRYAAERVGAPGVQGGTIPIKMGPKAVARSLWPRQRPLSGRSVVRGLLHGDARLSVRPLQEL